MLRPSRYLAQAAAGLIGLGVLSAVFWWWTRPPAVPPNVLLITIDTLRADRVGAYGARDLATPAFDRLAREGVRFEAAYATAPLTLPSHISMLSGLLPAAHTVHTNDGFRVPDAVPLVAEALRDAGYDTGAVVGSFVVRGAAGLQRGFAHYDDEIGSSGERRGDVVAERARAWLERPRSSPWFLWVHFFDPHLEYDPPEPYRSQYRGRAYDGEVAYTDAQVAGLVRFLEDRNLLEHSAILMAGDHGEGLGDHGEHSHGALLYDPMISVPLLLRLPAGTHRGRVIAEPVSLVEIAPTILEIAGLSPGLSPPGLLAQLRSPAPRPAPPISETRYLTTLLGWSPLYSLRAGRYKVIDAPTAELYDVDADPAESRNLASGQSQRVADLIGVLRTELARSTSVAAVPARADHPEARQRLAALGYVSSSGSVRPPDAAAGPSAMDRIELWQQIEQGLALAHRGDHAAAERVFKGVIREDADNALALKFLGARALEIGDFAGAVVLNQRLEATGLHVADALSNLALAYDRLGRASDALEAADRALAIAPDHVAARFNRAVVLGGMRREAEALRELTHVLEREPEHAGAHALRARLSGADGGGRAKARNLIAAGDLAGAARVLEAIIADEPRAAELHDELGTLRARLGDVAGARSAFERALALNPNAIDVRERLAAVLHQLRDRKAARTHFEEVLARAPDRRAPRLSLGIIELEDGRPDLAIEWLEPVSHGWEGAPQALLYLGHARLARQDRTGARRAYQACIEMAPRGAPVALEARRHLDALR